MTDLEIVKACAEAMGWTVAPFESDPKMFRIFDESCNVIMGIGKWNVLHEYYPLTDDAQCFALVKRFCIHIYKEVEDGTEWEVSIGADQPIAEAYNADLNHAICECVAKMWQAKGSPA